MVNSYVKDVRDFQFMPNVVVLPEEKISLLLKCCAVSFVCSDGGKKFRCILVISPCYV
jgi:hypothetical protein